MFQGVNGAGVSTSPMTWRCMLGHSGRHSHLLSFLSSRSPVAAKGAWAAAPARAKNHTQSRLVT